MEPSAHGPSRPDRPDTRQESRSNRAPSVSSVTRMGVKVSQCFVAVDDHEKAIAFYRDVLGFEVLKDIAFEGLRWVTLGSAAQPDADIVLQSLVVDPETSPADQQALASLLAKGLLPGLVFRTDDCDAMFERLREAGATVTQEPTDQPWGVRDCAVQDPAGNALRFAQPRSR